MYEIKTEDAYEDFRSNKEMFDFSNKSTKSKYYYHSNKLVIGTMKDETGGVAFEEFLGLKPEHVFNLSRRLQHNKKPKGVNKIVVVIISDNEYKKRCVIE